MSLQEESADAADVGTVKEWGVGNLNLVRLSKVPKWSVAISTGAAFFAGL